jgi:hypothetical protein
MGQGIGGNGCRAVFQPSSEFFTPLKKERLPLTNRKSSVSIDSCVRFVSEFFTARETLLPTDQMQPPEKANFFG